MSGTSADGIDIALTKISGAPPNLNAKLLNHTSVDFPPQVRKEILRIAEQTPVPAGDLSQMNFRLGEIYAEAALTACKRFRISPKKIAILGNHGQTIFHQGPPVQVSRQTDRLHAANRRRQRNRRPHRHHHRFRLPPRRHRPRRPGRASRPIRRLSALSPSQTRARLAQSRRHRQHHRPARRLQTIASLRLRHRPRQHSHRRTHPAFHAWQTALRQRRQTRAIRPRRTRSRR